MSVWSELSQGVRNVLLMQHQLDLLSTRVDVISAKIEIYDTRLVRIETIIDLARNARLSRD